MNYNNFCIEKGNKKIMLSAPHCVDHYRNGKIKKREINTDTLIKKIKEKSDINIIYKTESLNEDANYDDISEYRNKAKEFVNQNNICLFLDIHGMDYDRKQDICIGTAYGKNVHNRKDIIYNMIKIFNKYGYKNVTIDMPFSASNDNCVSTYISNNCNIPSFQIEINNKYRFEESDFFDMDKLVEAFVELINITI
jgi:hypothetical protein